MGCRNGSAGFSVQFTTLTFVFVRKSLGATRSKEHRHWPLQFVSYHEDTTHLSFIFRDCCAAQQGQRLLSAEGARGTTWGVPRAARSAWCSPADFTPRY